MNTTIESLKELYVKLGGSLEDVKNKTTIPEMIDAITEVAGGSAPTYETVAEIQVGEMIDKGSEGFVYQSEEDFPEIPEGVEIFFNSGDYPLVFYKDGYYGYNCEDPEEGAVDPNKPFFVIYKPGEKFTMRSSEDLSNTTVRILKKVEQGGGGDSSDSGKFVVDLTYDYVSDEKVWSATHNGEPISIADIYDEIVDGKNVVCCTDQIDAMPTDGIPVTVYMEEQGVYFISFSYMTTSMVGEFGGISIFATHEESDVWSVGDGKLVTDEALENLKPTYEFDFSAESGDGSFTATPASGVTYAAIASALAETPHVFAKITFPSAMGLVVYARFNESVTGDGQTVYYANGLVILGGNPTAIGLNIGDNAGQTVCVGTVKTLAVAT